MYDAETVLKNVEALLKAELDTQIGCINTIKSDAIVLDTIPADHYLFETLDSRVNNFKKPFIMYGLTENESKGAQLGNYVETVTVTVEVAFFDCGIKNRSTDVYKLLRYREALKRTVLKNPDIFRGYGTPLIKSLNPASFPFDNKRVILSCGLNVTVSITGD